MPHKTGIRLLGVARNPANGFPARLLGGQIKGTEGSVTSKLKPKWNLHFRDDEGQAKVLGEGFQPAHKAGPLLPLSLLNMYIPPWH